ncbi:hypothetical protein [Demequina lignilytica]|uniref:Uncharacterized protein n=1 Tax=Demequina lignilytica TaxID=3051663 RepID=A0AB35MI78_9MICO|nr:hypothetical protein [Demequina sp. SYSU T0a273]MDN4483524.1 hypothetical protein [Demequina sp. SYSU T0a273]
MTATAWVESPLQVLNAVEWAHRAGEGCRIVLREDVESLGPLGAWLAPRLEDTAPGVVLDAAPDPARAGLRRSGRWVVGDVFSGQIRLLVALSRTRDLVVLDDGSATLHLAQVLQGGGGFGRMGQRESLPARVLGAIMRRRLLRAARAGRLELFTAYDAPEVGRLADLGATLTPNRYAWVRGLEPAEPGQIGAHVVIGSALAADGYIDAAAYEAWAIATGGPGATYLPHRRETDAALARLATAGLRVVRSALPAELVLATAADLESVTSLPSSTAATLAHVLGPSVTHRIQAVPTPWWTAAADESMRSTLSATVPRS